MKHATVAIKFDDLLDRVAGPDANWRMVIGFNDDACGKIERDLALAGESGDLDKEQEMLDALTEAEDAIGERLAKTWWKVCWPEHVLRPRYNSDASYSGPYNTREDCEADTVYGG